MSSKSKFRVGEIVYHRTLDFGAGTVRYVSRDDLIVNFEKAPVQRYKKYEICKSATQRTNPNMEAGAGTAKPPSSQAA
jgi:transcription elongation factor GreA-like protein